MADRPLGRVLPDRVGPHGGPFGAPVGQGRLRGRGAREVRPARARDAHDAAPRGRPRARARRRRDRPRDHPAGGRGLRPALRGRHHRRVPGREPRADGHAAAAAARAPSTTSWSRSRSSAPARSRAARCTRTCGGATARSRSPIRIPLLEPLPREDARVCRCSRSSSCRWRSTSPGSPPAESDQLRQAMGSKRSQRPHGAMRERLMEGMAERGITGETAEEIAHKLEAFADFGFPESHSVSFAYLVYSSSWIKFHYPAEFACRAAQRAADGLLLAAHDRPRRGPSRGGGARPVRQRVAPRLHARAAHGGASGRSGGRSPAGTPTRRSTRCGSGCATCAGSTTRCSTTSTTSGPSAPFADMEDFTRRTGAPVDALEALATAGAFGVLRPVAPRRAVGRGRVARRSRPTRLPESSDAAGLVTGVDAPPLPGMTELEETAADLWAMGLSAGRHPTEFVREAADAHGASSPRPTCGCCPTVRVVEVAGVVTHRQQPATAQGHGVPEPRGRDRARERDLHARCVAALPQGRPLRPALEIRGVLERHQGVTNVLARRIAPLTALTAGTGAHLRARNFR